MVVVLIVYSCMGMQLYGGGFNFDGEPPPRENFDNFVMAFLGLFQVCAILLCVIFGYLLDFMRIESNILYECC